jgi:LmbE family N-acetylglucosaminyl deacetylase
MDARRKELTRALTYASIPSEQCLCFHLVDQDVQEHLPWLIARLKAVVERLRPSVVLSPAYEGGHPDHDSVALAVAAVRKLASRGFDHYEYSLYHAGPRGRIITGIFLPAKGCVEENLLLTPEERRLKTLMLNCFTSQRPILKFFKVAKEKLRSAPRYNFLRPPHPGPLLYEQWWGMSGKKWRELARQVIRQMQD